MSDLEFANAGDVQMDGDASDFGGEDFKEDSKLPEGVKKEILTEVSGEWKTPKQGDEVKVHYVGLLEDGTEFDSSRSRGQPFTFTLGKGEVIKGWDLGVATMKRGEVAKFTLAPEFAYGEAGSPPKIPANATLVFEVELLSWVSKEDLFQDGGVIKSELKAGTGWQKPKSNDEVRLSLRLLASAEKPGEGAVLEERSSIDYTLGSNALGPLSRVVDKALVSMKKEEQVCLICNKDYSPADQPEGVHLQLTLDHIYETQDVSFQKDSSIMKKVLQNGNGYDKPADGCQVKLRVEAATDNAGTVLPGFAACMLEFAAGNGEVCDVLECAVSEMKKGEKALVTCTRPELCIEEKLGLKLIEAQQIQFTVELEDFSKNKETWNLSEEEKVDFGTSRKEVGSKLFRSGRTQLAMRCYKKVIDLFRYAEDIKDEERKRTAKDLKKACELNIAACQLKIEAFSEAMASCDNILKEESANLKALFRRAQAEMGLKNFLDAIRDLRRVIELEPQNKEARILLKEARAEQKVVDEEAKGLFMKMCKKLGHSTSPKTTTAEQTSEAAEPTDIAEQTKPEHPAEEPAAPEPEPVAVSA